VEHVFHAWAGWVEDELQQQTSSDGFSVVNDDESDESGFEEHHEDDEGGVDLDESSEEEELVFGALDISGVDDVDQDHGQGTERERA